VISKIVHDPLADRTMTIWSLRPGDWPDVVDSVRADARDAGYAERPPPESPPLGLSELPPRNLRFSPPPGVPHFALSAYAPGETIETMRNETIPPGHTVLRLRLY